MVPAPLPCGHLVLAWYSLPLFHFAKRLCFASLLLSHFGADPVFCPQAPVPMRCYCSVLELTFMPGMVRPNSHSFSPQPLPAPLRAVVEAMTEVEEFSE